MFSIRVAKSRLGFSAAHFLVSHEKCGRLHGHNYRVRVAVRGEPNADGMVIDFGALMKEALKVCKEIDQKVILAADSPDIRLVQSGGETRVRLPDREYVLPASDVVVLPIRASTAEEIAEYFCRRISENMKGVEWVEVEESPGSAARYLPGSS